MTSRILRFAVAALLLPAMTLNSLALDFDYTTQSGKVTLTKYTGPGGHVSIPREINGLPVTGIGHGAFFWCTNVATINIPDSVTDIAGIVFSGCVALEAFVVEPANPAFCSVDGVLFNKAMTTLRRCPLAKAGSYVVPGTVARIEPYAFGTCYGLTGIIMPDSVTTIGSDAFYFCESLTCVTIPPGVNNIEPWSFAYNRSLTNLTFRGGITNIGDYAFYDARLRTVTIPDTVVTLGANAFDGNDLSQVVLGSGLTSIGHSAFSGNATAVYSRGNAPTHGTNFFGFGHGVTVYYLPGTSGWEATYADLPTALWLPRIEPVDTGSTIDAGELGFNVIWTPGRQVTVEAAESLSAPAWAPLYGGVLTGDSAYFNDPDWKNYRTRFYRVRSP